MKTLLKKAAELARSTGGVWLATADNRGRPHIAAAGKLEAKGEDRIALTEWFCPGTLENLKDDPWVSVVVWDRVVDQGYQLVGRAVLVEDVEILDGYRPEDEASPPMPQVQRRLEIEVDEALLFRSGPHSDRPQMEVKAIP